MKDRFVLEPLEVGKFPSFPLSKFLLGDKSEQSIPAPCISWFGKSLSSDIRVLVDTGPAKQTPETSKLHQKLEAGDDYRIDKVLQTHGIEPSEITHVIFTHLHFDHCSYAQYLPNAKIYVQKSELQYAVAPDDNSTGYETGNPGIIPSWMSSFDKMVPITGDFEIAPGLLILALPGHTIGSLGVIFDTNGGRYAVAGDLINQIDNWEGNKGGHIPPTANISIDLCNQSFKRLEKESDKVLASHDYRMFDYTRYGDPL